MRERRVFECRKLLLPSVMRNAYMSPELARHRRKRPGGVGVEIFGSGPAFQDPGEVVGSIQLR